MPNKAEGSIIARSQMRICANAVSDTLMWDTYPYQKDIVWHRVVARAVGVQPDLIRIYLKRASDEIELSVRKPNAAGVAVVVSSDAIAPGDYRLCADYDNVAVGTELRLAAFAHTVDYQHF